MGRLKKTYKKVTEYYSCLWILCTGFCSTPTKSMHLNTPCQTAQSIPQFFVALFGSPLVFSTITNTWFSLQIYHDKITVLKHKSAAHRLWVKHALALQWCEGHPQPQRIAPTDHHTHICVLTIKATRSNLWQTTPGQCKWSCMRAQGRSGQEGDTASIGLNHLPRAGLFCTSAEPKERALCHI